MNFEFYYFADTQAKRRFDADPQRWCGTVTDPISHKRFRPTSESAHAEFDGVPFFFETAQSAVQFAANPDSFSVIRTEMLPMMHSDEMDEMPVEPETESESKPGN